MNIDKLAKISEIVGSMAVVISLIYVGYQINENTKSQRAATAQNIAADFRDTFNFTLEEDELFTRSRNMEMLSEAENLKVRQMYAVLLRTYENIWYQANKGALDPELYRGYQGYIGRTLSSPIGKQLWRDSKFHSGFVKDTEDFIAKNPYEATF
ncbi:MAG: hypothetical protein ACI95C_001743 [Pseudohongiellaceae bacterium]|jgi:hypothetical protein